MTRSRRSRLDSFPSAGILLEFELAEEVFMVRPFDELLKYLYEHRKAEFLRGMKEQRIHQSTWSTWIHRGSVPRPSKRESVFRALRALVDRDEIEAALALSDRGIALTGGYAGEVDRAQRIERGVGELERDLAALARSRRDKGWVATARIYRFASDPRMINAVAADPPCITGAPRIYKQLVQSRRHYGEILAAEVPGFPPEHYQEVFRLVFRLCAGSVHELFRPSKPQKRLLPRAISGAAERRSDQDEIAEIHRAVIATACWLAAQVGTHVPLTTPSIPPSSHIM
jgi:hypothetical protein